MKRIMDLGIYGKFVLEQVIIDTDYVRIFTCVTENHQKVLLFIENDFNDNFEEWIAFFSSEKEIYDLIANNVSIQKTFINPMINEYLRIRHLFDKDEYTVSKLSMFPENFLANGDDFLYIPNDVNNQQWLSFGISEFQRTENPQMLMRFNPYTSVHSVKVGFLSSFLENINKTYNFFAKKKGDSLLAECVTGSFVIRFQDAAFEDLTENTTSAAIFECISKVLSSSSAQEMDDLLSINPKVLPSLKNLVGELEKHDRDFEIAVISSDKSKPSVARVKSENIHSLKRSLNDYKIKEIEQTRNYKGVLTGFDKIRKTFSFIPDGLIPIKGKISKNFVINKNDEYRVLSRYVATIENKIEADGEGKESNSYQLLKAESIG